MLIGCEEIDIQGAGLGFRSRPSHMQVVGCAIWIAVRRILWQQDLGNWVGSNGVEVRRAIEHSRSENERVYLVMSIVGSLGRPGLADIGNKRSTNRFDSVGVQYSDHARQRSNALCRRNSITKVVRARVEDYIGNSGYPKDVAIEALRQNLTERQYLGNPCGVSADAFIYH